MDRAAKNTQLREWRAKNRDKVAAHNRSAQDYKNAWGKKQWAENKEFRLRILARHSVQVAIRKGKIVRPEMCQCCYVQKATDAHHHNGYDNLHRFDVVWLCESCHGKAHRRD